MDYHLLEAPSILGLKPSGVELLPQRLLDEGLAQRLAARHAGRVEPLAYSDIRDPRTGTLNAEAIARYAVALADAVGSVLDRGAFPVILGGDCSIVLGPLLALKRRGRYGLLFIDGHADFYQPEVNPNGEAASMDLAFATGHGPRLLTDIEGRGPLVKDEDVVVYGFRDADEQAQYGSQPLPPVMPRFDLAAVRRLGTVAAAEAALAPLRRPELEGFFIHLDADCLDDAVMPAVDYRLPDGLSTQELVAVLRAARASGRAVGIEVTIYNPRLDRDGSAGRALVQALVDGLGGGLEQGTTDSLSPLAGTG
ncbi:arginase family protein [Piscinibacter sp. XHJ-5]|uniref:arginase family protein n=1 Tax=Piscinibacter sp. XHJ-5 TaxID=3037797 RepID=UPI002452B6C0|nr:arginase family protein [Piscinibacter sp. XHJ-5]